MTKLFLAAALIASLATPALAGGKQGEKSFSRDGQTYVYTTTAKPDRVVISGRRFPEGSAFELVVRGDQVTGVSGGEPVSFTYKDAQAKLTSQQLASR
jgi:hypothetical protein